MPSNTQPPDERPPLVAAIAMAQQLIAIALEMALPALGGYWIDRWLGTRFVFVLLGAIFGFAAGMWHLLKLTGQRPSK